MKRRVAFVEFSIFDQFPLVSGYLHAYAQADPVVAGAFDFVYYTPQVERVRYQEALAAIRGLRAHIVCISCYVWNMGLVKRLVRDLVEDSTVERIILGGHQVSHHIEQYVRPSDSKVIVVNGQGEIPFRGALARIADAASLEGLRGVSFYADGQLWNGGEAEMLSNLDDIPSPFLGGQFDHRMHPTAVFETNRGCPYKCSFCTWGGDTLTVRKFSLDRIKDELQWLAKRSVMFLSIADANWGMLPRDIEISAYISQLKKDYGSPFIVYYAAAKNKPNGSLACIDKFHEGGVITSQALGIQSLSDQTLEVIDRRNIKNSAFLQMFDELKSRKIDSYCELIWPLPGETLQSLQSNFERLVALGAQTTIMYPAILINNAKMTARADEHELESVTCRDWKSEIRTITKTKWASHAEVEQGFWFYYAYFLLGNFDLRKALLVGLSQLTGMSYASLISDFASYLQANIATSEYAVLVQSILAEQEHGALMTAGRLGTHLTHEARLGAQCDVANFVMGLDAGDPRPRLALATLWTWSMSRLFSDTSDDHDALSAHLESLGRLHGVQLAVRAGRRPDGVELDADDDVWRDIVPLFTGEKLEGAVQQIRVHHPVLDRRYLARDRSRSFAYAHGAMQRLTYISTRVSTASLVQGV